MSACVRGTRPGVLRWFTVSASQVNQILNKCRDDAGKAAYMSVDLTNNIIKMVTAGSKGSNINISQMMGCVGQQNVEGKRIPFGFWNRCVSRFSVSERSPPACVSAVMRWP